MWKKMRTVSFSQKLKNFHSLRIAFMNSLVYMRGAQDPTSLTHSSFKKLL